MSKAKPTRAAIAALEADPSKAAEFDRKYVESAAQVHLLALISKRLDELIDHVAAKKRVIHDSNGEIVGVEIADDDEETSR